MSGFRHFLRKEFVEIVRTWRIWVLPGMLLFFAISSPPLAQLTPRLLESAMQGQEGMKIIIPDPTYLDAYGQWIKNLQQMVIFVMLLTAGGMIAGERSSGTAVLVLTKPVSRGAFVIAKYVAQAAMLTVATLIGTLVCWGITYLTFSEAPFERLATSTATWLGFALMLLAVMTLLSSAFKSLAAGGLGIGVFFVLSILPLWGPALRYSPAGLGSAPNALLAGESPALVWPIATAAIGVVVLVTAAVLVFSRREI